MKSTKIRSFLLSLVIFASSVSYLYLNCCAGGNTSLPSPLKQEIVEEEAISEEESIQLPDLTIVEKFFHILEKLNKSL